MENINDMDSKEEVLLGIFNPSPQDGNTWRQDLQLAVTLNPSIELIEDAMDDYAKQFSDLRLKQFIEYLSRISKIPTHTMMEIYTDHLKQFKEEMP